MTTERRNDEKRRNGANGSTPETDHRTGVERRQQPDRRGTYQTVKFTTLDALDELSGWLDNNCDGKWIIGIQDLENARGWGNYRIRFELEPDQPKFTNFLAANWPKWMA